MRYPPAILLAGLLLISPAQAQTKRVFFNDFEDPPFSYNDQTFTDPMTRLLEAEERGEVDLGEALGKENIAHFLNLLDIPVESQVIVFSKTSLQRDAMDRGNPRAIYFNDNVYLGWMPGGRIEITSIDPLHGGRFFFEDPREEPSPPRFQSPRRCFGCHAGSATNYLPGLLASSVFADETARPLRQIQSFEAVSHAVSPHERWGGWYVSGNLGSMEHMGNLLAVRGQGGLRVAERSPAGRVTLDKYFDTSIHLRPDSDIVPLLVHDHQVGIHNKLMEAGYKARADLLNADGEVTDKVIALGRKHAASLVRRLLFADEAPLPEDGLSGAGDFEPVFIAQGRTDPAGRSLREFHLSGRLFRNRCSYMVHSPVIDAFPPYFRELLVGQIHEILTAPEAPEGFEYFEEGERENIHEILSATLEGYPAGG